MERLNDLPCPVLVTDRSGVVVDANSGLLHLVGGDKAVWLGQPMENLFSIPGRILLQTHVWPMLLRDGHLEEIKLEVVDTNKQRSPVLVNCKRSGVEGAESFFWVLYVSRERSRFEHALLAARDRAEAGIKVIADRERALAALSEELLATQEKVRMANESGGVGIWELNLQTGDLIWDDLMYRLYGLAPHAGSNAYALWASHLHPDDRDSAEAAFQHALASGDDFFNEFRVLWPDGSVHHLRGFGRLRKDDSGMVVRIVGTNIDVTETHLQSQALKDARDKAQAASQSKGQFLANMSHEIRTPMNAILGMLQLVQGTDLNAQQRDYVSKSESAAQSLLSLINDILDFSKIEAGKMTLEHQPFSLEHLLRGLAVVLSANTAAKGMEVLFDIDPALPPAIVGDAMRLQQVLINLGGNAVKFTSIGQVTVSLYTVHQDGESVTVRFAVQDTGIGIAPENQAHIFSDFAQAEGSTTRKFGGTGLGLSICSRIVRLMGGNIQIDSVLGQGSTFSFTLTFPVSRDPRPAPWTAQATAFAPRTLVIDDNPVAGPLTLRMLQSMGWEVQLASSGAQALAIIAAGLQASAQTFPFEALYVDWYMPHMDGWETIRQIRELTQRHALVFPKVIMVTGGGRETLEQRSMEEQQLLSGFLVKPFTAGMLHDAYRQASSSKIGVRTGTKTRKRQRQLAGMRILVVEDNMINQQVADELLSLEGAIVSLAANGQQGVDAVAAAAPPFDVVLMDLQMPVLDGYGATKAIRTGLGLKDLPIIAMTANAMATDRAACLDAGMNEHVSKPFDIAKLVSLLIRITGLQSHPDRAGEHEPGIAPVSPAPEIPGLDMASALARMSGMRDLYARTARDFSKVLHTVVPELRHFAAQGEQKAALMRLHTLKGHAATVGANALASQAAALEKVCTSDDWVARCSDGLDGLARLCESTHRDLALALARMDPAGQTGAGRAARDLDPTVVLPMLQELAALAAASDLHVLQRFADLRESLAGLPGYFLGPLEEALQNLDTAGVCELCSHMVIELKDSANQENGVSHM